MSDTAEIIVIRALHPGIYKSHGGGETTVYSRHASGPRGLTNAINSHYQERNEARNGFGNIGMGAGWIEVVPEGGNPGDGMRLDHPLFGLERGNLPEPPIGGAPYSWWQFRLRLAAQETEQFLREDEERAQREYEDAIASGLYDGKER